jgi:transcription antitermination factor NusA-like protein
VHKANRGPQVAVSRTHKNLLRRLFELEVPEIFRGSVEIKAIAREPGFRSKVAVYSRQQGIDPVGACVGLRGIRIQNIVNELNGERIDVVQWDPDPARFVANALSPAQVHGVRILPDGTTAEVIVGDRQLSLAIGKEGQNARLGAKLTGLRIDIKSLSAAEDESQEPALAMSAEPEVRRETPIWAELAEQEQEAAAAAAAERGTAEVAATVAEPVAEPAQPEAPAPPVAAAPADRPGAVRFADEILPSARPATDAPARSGGRRRSGRDAGRTRDSEEQARRRGGPAGRRAAAGGRRSLDDEIEEELEAALEDENFDFFGLGDKEDE